MITINVLAYICDNANVTTSGYLPFKGRIKHYYYYYYY